MAESRRDRAIREALTYSGSPAAIAGGEPVNVVGAPPSERLAQAGEALERTPFTRGLGGAIRSLGIGRRLEPADYAGAAADVAAGAPAVRGAASLARGAAGGVKGLGATRSSVAQLEPLRPTFKSPEAARRYDEVAESVHSQMGLSPNAVKKYGVAPVSDEASRIYTKLDTRGVRRALDREWIASGKDLSKFTEPSSQRFGNAVKAFAKQHALERAQTFLGSMWPARHLIDKAYDNKTGGSGREEYLDQYIDRDDPNRWRIQ